MNQILTFYADNNQSLDLKLGIASPAFSYGQMANIHNLSGFQVQCSRNDMPTDGRVKVM